MYKQSTHFTSLIPWLFVFLWSTGFVGAKYSLPHAEPFTLLTVRMLITLVVFAGLIFIFKSKSLNCIQILHQMVVGALIHFGYLGCVFAAIKIDMPTGVLSLIVGLQPILTAWIAWLALSERLSYSQWLGLFIGLAGVALVLTSGQRLGDFTISNKAFVLSILALISISLGTLYQKRFGQATDLITGSFYQYLSAVILLAIVAFIFESRQVDWSLQFVLAIGWLVFGLSVTAILLLMYLIRQGETSKTASYFYLVPILVALESWLLFDEHLSTPAIIGMFITVIGIYLVHRDNKSKTSE